MDPVSENLDDILKKLLSANLGVKAAAIVSREGLPIASAISEGMDETRVAVMACALFSLGNQSIIEVGEGDLVGVYIKGSDGHLSVIPIGPTAIMLLSTEDGLDESGLDLLGRLGPFKPPASSSGAATVEKDL